MTGSRQTKKYLPLFLPALLLVAALIFPSPAAAYSARSTGGSIPGYGVARSQPQLQSGPPAAPAPSPGPERPAVPTGPGSAAGFSPPQQSISFNGSSYGRARSSHQGALHPAPPAPLPEPVGPPVSPKPPQKPPDPVVPQPPPPGPPPTGGEEITLNLQELRLLELVNSERSSRGLAPLQLDAQLTYLARLKSQDMIDLNYFAHESPTYGSSGEMLRNAGVKFSLAAENIGVGGNLQAIFDAFMNSSGHRSKIIDPRYTRTGIGVIYKPGRGYLVTQLFAALR